MGLMNKRNKKTRHDPENALFFEYVKYMKLTF